jgi:micrococcal nuclease
MRVLQITFVIAAILVGLGWIMTDQRFGPSDRLELPAEPAFSLAGRRDELGARFLLCEHSIRVNCVIDGDTFWFRGDKYRIADIDAPEIFEPRCKAEKRAGELARDRLLVLLNEGTFSLATGSRDEDRYRRKLRTVWRSGKSLGKQLVQERLARRWGGPDIDWCAAS